MKEKLEASQISKNFNNMIQNQFQTKIEVLKINNAREYFKSILSDYFLSQGIVHQSSCIDTPQQNGVVKEKKKHFAKVTRPLMFPTHVPKHFQGGVGLTVAYPINRMTSQVLNFQTPCQVLLNSYPRTRIISTIPISVFG